MSNEMFEKGVEVREAMFGAEHGRARVEAADDFTKEFEVLVTEYCFGEIWGREELTRAERSMITLGMLLALGRSFEIQVHTQGAIANGVSRTRIREIMIHAAAYCGIPAAVDGFRNAREALDRLGVE